MANLAIPMMLLMPLLVVAVISVDAGEVETDWRTKYIELTEKGLRDEEYAQLISDILELLKSPANRVHKHLRADFMLLDRAAQIDPNLCDIELAEKLLKLANGLPSLESYLKYRVKILLKACIDEESAYLRYDLDNSHKGVEDLLMELDKSVPEHYLLTDGKVYGSDDLKTAATKRFIEELHKEGTPREKKSSPEVYMKSLRKNCELWFNLTTIFRKYVNLSESVYLYDNVPLAEEQRRWVNYVKMCKIIDRLKAPDSKTIKKVREELIKNQEKEAAISTNEIQIKETSVSE